MKKLLLVLAIACTGLLAQAQFSKATLQATGLTCAMCSNAINKALMDVPFVASVRSDIKNSAFNIVFKKDQAIVIDDLKKAVEDAGFSVGSLKVTGAFDALKVNQDDHLKIGDMHFHFLNVKEQILAGENTLTIVDKNFLSAKEFKKISASSKMNCVQTGKAASCCMSEAGIKEGARIYHVTI